MTESTQIQVGLRRPTGFRLDVDAAWDARVTVLFGPSGSGKSTLLEVVLGLEQAAHARIRLAGRWLDDTTRGLHVPAPRRRLGWVPQDPTLLPHLSVSGNLRLGLRRAGVDGGRALERAVDVLEIGGLLERRVDALSGGERQRVALARALASGPEALLLDEPLSSLDLPLRARVLPFLLRVRDELGLPMIYITHDPDEALLLGECVVVLDGGRAVASGPPREVLWSRTVLPLSEALGIENVIDARVVKSGADGSIVEAGGGLRLALPVELEPDATVRLGIPAHDLLLAADPPGRISARNVVPAVVAACETAGGEAHVHLDAGERLVAKLTPAAVTQLELRPGARVFLVIKATAIRRLA